MKIVMIAVGTRGDMEPFVAIGKLLQNKGHRVICSMPGQFLQIVDETGLEFESLGEKYIKLLDSEDGRAAMGESTGFRKLIATIKLAIHQTEANKELVNKQYEIIQREEPDRVIYNGKSVFPIIWELYNRGKTILISPVPYLHYVEGHAHLAFNSNYGKLINRLTFSLAHFGMVTTVMISRKWLRIKDMIRRKDIKDVLRHAKAIYTISPTLFAQPDNWKSNIRVLGYYKFERNVGWHPDKELTDFMSNHSKILFITFGSMVNPQPVVKTKIIIDILEKNKIPAIINTASGGLIKPDIYDRDLIHFVCNIPYDWIFPKVYAVMHHGGSGTTHLGLKFGCATLIIPHILDQHVWNKIVYDLGAGPLGIKIGKIAKENIEPKILILMNDSRFREKARQIQKRMSKEDFREELYNFIVK